MTLIRKLAYIAVVFALILEPLYAQLDEFDLSNPSFVESLISKIDKRLLEISLRAHTCKDSTPFAGQYSHSPYRCEQYDIVLFAGLGCLASRLAGDLEDSNGWKQREYADQRCLDVFLSQLPEGRWVRGESTVQAIFANQALAEDEREDLDRSFSRDMSKGVEAAYLATILFDQKTENKERALSALKSWIDYINRDQKGTHMCDERGIGNRCNIFQGKGSAAALYRVLKESQFRNSNGEKVKAIDASNSSSKMVKKMVSNLNRYHPRSERRELAIMPWDGYGVHLKSANLLFHRVINQYVPAATDKELFDDRQYDKFAKAIYNKTRTNPWFEFMYKGLHLDLWRSIMNTYCPSQLPPIAYRELNHVADSSYAWQSKKFNLGHEAGDGHDCIFLLEMIKASLKKRVKLAVAVEPSNCPKNTEDLKHQYQGLPVCHKRKYQASAANCQRNGGYIKYDMDGRYRDKSEVVIQENGEINQKALHGKAKYCLIRKKGYYRRFRLERVCPWPLKFYGIYNGEDQAPKKSSSPEAFAGTLQAKVLPVCEGGFPKKISMPKCYNKIHRKPVRIFDEENAQNDESIPEGPTHCLINKGEYFVMRRIGRSCPMTHKFLGFKQGWGWPICRRKYAVKAYTSDQCLELQSNGVGPVLEDPELNHCLAFNTKSYFDAYPLDQQMRVEPNSTEQTPEQIEFKTEVQKYSGYNDVHDQEFSVEKNQGIHYRLNGRYSFRTIADRAGDYFYTQVFVLYRDGSRKEVLDEAGNPVIESVSVMYNRKRKETVEGGGVFFEGLYRQDYNFQVNVKSVDFQLQFETYLVTNTEDRPQGRRVLKYTGPLNSRNFSLIKKDENHTPYPNPFVSTNDLSLRFEVDPRVATDLGGVSKFTVGFTLYSGSGKVLKRSGIVALLGGGPQVYSVGIGEVPLAPGNYFLAVDLYSGDIPIQRVASYPLIKH